MAGFAIVGVLAFAMPGLAMAGPHGERPVDEWVDGSDEVPDWWRDDDGESWSGAGGGWYGSADPQRGWRPSQAQRVRARNLRIDRGAISPNADGRADTVTVRFSLSRRSLPVRVLVVDSAGAVVRTLGDAAAGDAAQYTWDGNRDDGQPAADGDYALLLAASDQLDGALRLDVTVDRVVPTLSVRRPTLMQLRRLSRRVAAVRDRIARLRAQDRREARRGRHGNGHGHGNANGNDSDGGWRDREEWVAAWQQGGQRLPVSFTTAEEGTIDVTARIGSRTARMSTWREAGRHTVEVPLPTYVSGGRLELTLATSDDADNRRAHTMLLRLPKLPPPPKRRTSTTTSGGGSTSPTKLPVTDGPLPDWLDPIMLRATYEAGVPQSWATSKALANVIQRESSFRPTAQNPTSTAYGLFQFLDQTWANVGCRKTSDAYRQSVCGLRYIQRRYRTPERAWAFWQANHWY